MIIAVTLTVILRIMIATHGAIQYFGYDDQQNNVVNYVENDIEEPAEEWKQQESRKTSPAYWGFH